MAKQEKYQYQRVVEEVDLTGEDDDEVLETITLDEEEVDDTGDRTIYSLLRSKAKSEDWRSPSFCSSSVVKEEEEEEDIQEVYSSLVPTKQQRTKKRVLDGITYPAKKRLFYGKQTSLGAAAAAAAAASVVASPGSSTLVKSARVLVKPVPVLTSARVKSSIEAAGREKVSGKVNISKCGCKNKWVGEKCIRRALKKWNPETYMICEACFNGEYNQAGHACLGYIKPDELVSGEVIEEHFRKRAWYTILKPSTIIELYQSYKEDHREVIDDVDDDVIMKNMKYGLWREMKVNMSSVIDILHEKDKKGKKE